MDELEWVDLLSLFASAGSQRANKSSRGASLFSKEPFLNARVYSLRGYFKAIAFIACPFGTVRVLARDTFGQLVAPPTLIKTGLERSASHSPQDKHVVDSPVPLKQRPRQERRMRVLNDVHR
ncbi:hypothetical protein HZH66_004092 [Vespula vulgaris]|uniref:Uncharacterized protein n=1 Tax=Vespula vulgaris TaxID=7454 RepID=A0A834KEB8_VESVU|nr:hypothetical protein HZH66_004092 [Vespula vulgaris]